MQPMNTDGAPGGPGRQVMGEFLADVDSIFVRQKLQIFEQCCPLFEKSNSYRVAAIPLEIASRPKPPTDEEFFQYPQIAYMQEYSTCCCRVCCMNSREFSMGVYSSEALHSSYGKQETMPAADLLQIQRPFKCTMLLCCFVLFPQTLTISNGQGEPLGSSTLDCGIKRLCWQAQCMGEVYTRVEGVEGETRFFLKEIYPTLCNCCTNCLAPTCLNESKKAEILDPTEVKVGDYRDIYPGMIGCRCLSDATNYSMTFPKGASPQDKQLLLASLMLMEYMVHEKKPGDNA